MNIKPSGIENRPICVICVKASSRYCCPKCNAPYCSVECYRDHGINCTEDFYRQHVLDEMGVRASEDDTSQAHLLSRLKTIGSIIGDSNPANRAQDSAFNDIYKYAVEEQEQYEESLIKLQNLEISSGIENVESLWESLSAENRTAFRRAVNSGQLSQTLGLSAWSPWWLDPPEKHFSCIRMHEQGRKISASVIDSSETKDNTGTNESIPPQIEGLESFLGNDTTFPPCERLLQIPWRKETDIPMNLSKVTPILQNNLIDLLLAYVLTLRYYLGQVGTDKYYTWHFGLNTTAASIRPNPSKYASSEVDVVMSTEVSQLLLHSSMVLKHDTRYQTPSDAISGFFLNLIALPETYSIYTSTSLEDRTKFNIALVRDLICLVQSPHLLQDALFHLGTILYTCIRAMKAYNMRRNTHTQKKKASDGRGGSGCVNMDGREIEDHDVVEILKTTVLAFKKVQFYISWCKKTFPEHEDIRVALDRIEEGVESVESILARIQMEALEFVHAAMRVTDLV